MRARRRDLWTSPLLLGVLALVVAAAAALVTVSVLESDDETAATSDTSTTSTTAATTTSASAGADGVPDGWYVVISSDKDTKTTKEAMAPRVADFDNGHVIDTDDFQTGNGLGPDFFPNAGAIAAVVGPYESHDTAAAFCSGGEDDQDEEEDAETSSCPVRQLIARSQ